MSGDAGPRAALSPDLLAGSCGCTWGTTLCFGSGASSHCRGTATCNYSTGCYGACRLSPVATAEACNGRDDDCDGRTDEGAAAACDDGYACSTDYCLPAFIGSGAFCSSFVPASCEEIRFPVGEATRAEDGTWRMRRDNPRLTGRVQMAVQNQTTVYTPDPRLSRSFYPHSARLEASSADVFGFDSSGGWLWGEGPIGADQVAPFRSPPMRLPSNGAAVDVRLTTLRGQTGTPTMPAPRVRTVVHQATMRMDPRVLVVPVRVTQFVNRTNAITPARTNAYAYFERGAFTSSEVTGVDSVSGSSWVSSTAREVLPPSTANRTNADERWTSCDIQFRLEEVRVEVNPVLSQQLVTSCDCAASGILGSATTPTPFGQYVQSHGGSNLTALDVYVGGLIGGSGSGCPGGDLYGVACGPSTGFCHEPEAVQMWSTQVGRYGAFGGILLNATTDTIAFDGGLGAVSHELGHMLGLAHPYRFVGDAVSGVRVAQTSCTSWTWQEGDPATLMSPGVGDAPLRPEQCTRARCIAAAWLERFGRIDAARRDEVCNGG